MKDSERNNKTPINSMLVTGDQTAELHSVYFVDMWKCSLWLGVMVVGVTSNDFK